VANLLAQSVQADPPKQIDSKGGQSTRSIRTIDAVGTLKPARQASSATGNDHTRFSDNAGRSKSNDPASPLAARLLPHVYHTAQGADP